MQFIKFKKITLIIVLTAIMNLEILDFKDLVTVNDIILGYNMQDRLLIMILANIFTNILALFPDIPLFANAWIGYKAFIILQARDPNINNRSEALPLMFVNINTDLISNSAI